MLSFRITYSPTASAVDGDEVSHLPSCQKLKLNSRQKRECCFISRKEKRPQEEPSSKCHCSNFIWLNKSFEMIKRAHCTHASACATLDQISDDYLFCFVCQLSLRFVFSGPRWITCRMFFLLQIQWFILTSSSFISFPGVWAPTSLTACTEYLVIRLRNRCDNETNYTLNFLKLQISSCRYSFARERARTALDNFICLK